MKIKTQHCDAWKKRLEKKNLKVCCPGKIHALHQARTLIGKQQQVAGGVRSNRLLKSARVTAERGKGKG